MNYFALPGIVKSKASVATIAGILKETCEHFHLDPVAVQSKGRKMDNTYARQAVMYLLKKHTTAPLKVIGGFFGKDHTTAIYSIKTIESRMQVEESVKRDIRAIERRLYIIEKPQP